MKSFNFSLDKVLGYREQMLELEKNTLGVELSKENEIITAIERIQANLEEQDNLLKALMDDGTTIIKIRQVSNQIESLKYSLINQKQLLEKQQEAVQKQREIVVKANQDHTLLDKLKTKRKVQYDKECLKQENSTVEELIVNGLSRTTTATHNSQ